MAFWDSFTAGFKKFAGIVNMLLPVAAIFVPGMQLPAVAVKLIEKLPGLMAIADELFTEVNQGALKKSFVMSAMQQAATVYGDVATGGAKESFDKDIAPNLSVLIDQAVRLANAVQAGVVVDDSLQTAAEKAGIMG